MPAAVITVDGPSGTGKGTICKLLAKRLGWHYLDSGSLYRALAWGVLEAGVNPADESSVAQILSSIDVSLGAASSPPDQCIICNGHDITALIRSEAVSAASSKISSQIKVRERLLQLQQQARRAPGLITDGRDMGTVVFPDADYKFYLDASPEIRAKRRFDQLKQQGISVNLPSIEQALIERDRRDKERAISPLSHADDAIVIDTSDLTVEQVLAKVLTSISD